MTLAVSVSRRPKGGHQTGAQRERVRFGSEEQQNERAMSF